MVSFGALDSEPAALLDLIYRLAPPGRQVILLSIAEITGFSPANVATKIHRIKKLLGQQFSEGAVHAKPC